MALSDQTQNVISDMITAADNVLALQEDMEQIIARWNLNQIHQQLADPAEVQAIFPWLDQSHADNCINAFQALLTALGDNVSGQATNLIKMKG